MMRQEQHLPNTPPGMLSCKQKCFSSSSNLGHFPIKGNHFLYYGYNMRFTFPGMRRGRVRGGFCVEGGSEQAPPWWSGSSDISVEEKRKDKGRGKCLVSLLLDQNSPWVGEKAWIRNNCRRLEEMESSGALPQAPFRTLGVTASQGRAPVWEAALPVGGSVLLWKSCTGVSNLCQPPSAWEQLSTPSTTTKRDKESNGCVSCPFIVRLQWP